MMTVQAKTPSPGLKRLINEQLRQGGFDLKGTMRQALSKAEVSARSRAVGDSRVRADWLPNSDCLTEANVPPYIGSFQGAHYACVRV